LHEAPCISEEKLVPTSERVR